MIRVVRVEGRNCPVFVCHACGDPITDASLGAAVFRLGVEMSDVLFAHKGACHRTVEGRLGTGGAAVGWEELSNHLHQLVFNSGMCISDLQKIEQDSIRWCT